MTGGACGNEKDDKETRRKAAHENNPGKDGHVPGKAAPDTASMGTEDPDYATAQGGGRSSVQTSRQEPAQVASGELYQTVRGELVPE